MKGLPLIRFALRPNFSLLVTRNEKGALTLWGTHFCGVTVRFFCGVTFQFFCGVTIRFFCGVTVWFFCGVTVRFFCGVTVRFFCNSPKLTAGNRIFTEKLIISFNRTTDLLLYMNCNIHKRAHKTRPLQTYINSVKLKTFVTTSLRSVLILICFNIIFLPRSSHFFPCDFPNKIRG